MRKNITNDNFNEHLTITTQPSIAIICHSIQRRQQAKEFSLLHNLPLIKPSTLTKAKPYDLHLIFHDDLIELYDCQLKAAISIDFLKGSLAHRQHFGGGRGQAIAKAIGLKSGITPCVLDITAGLAGDAFVLATLGCSVTLVERSPIIACLIEDAIERATLSHDFQNILEQGFKLINVDANTYLNDTGVRLGEQPDVIYIDPMYPERKKSALVKKDMQILQRLHLQEDNPAELLENAMRIASKRVVVKRPAQAERLNDRVPSTCIKSKKTRYDVYAISKMR